jgi:hypothetical protein
MKKIVLLLIIFSLILVLLFQTVLSIHAVFITEETDKVTENNYKDYRNCTIKTNQGSVDGNAFLFPGWGSSGWWSPSGPGLDVNGAFGILSGDGSDWTNLIYFNDDHYYKDWKLAYVFSFTGYFSNERYPPYGPVFNIDGTAQFVRVYFP